MAAILPRPQFVKPSDTHMSVNKATISSDNVSSSVDRQTIAWNLL